MFVPAHLQTSLKPGAKQGTNLVHVCRGAVEAMKEDHLAKKGVKPSG
jgi:hypothetical protein